MTIQKTNVGLSIISLTEKDIIRSQDIKDAQKTKHWKTSTKRNKK